MTEGSAISPAGTLHQNVRFVDNEKDAKIVVNYNLAFYYKSKDTTIYIKDGYVIATRKGMHLK